MELGLSHPLSRQRVCPSPRNQKGGAAGEGLGESQFRRLEKKLSTLPALCPHPVTGLKKEDVLGWGASKLTGSIVYRL
jgi:hypothetical protein